VFQPAGGQLRVGVAIGEHVLDLAAVAAAGLLPADPAAFAAPSLNAFLALGRATWTATRRRVGELLTAGNTELRAAGLVPGALHPQDAVHLCLPVEVADYVDFYSSLEHATNLGRLFRPGGEPLLPNWRHLPVAYHGRAGTVVPSGTPIVRPCGQRLSPRAGEPSFGPSTRLDIELEVGFVVGVGSRLGTPVPAADAAEHIFGLVLVNDWSARDIQAWEYQPLGPFLGKSFATSISPWVVPLDALAPFRAPARPQDPPVLPYLRAEGDWALDLDLLVELHTAGMAARGLPPEVISRTNLRHVYWTMPQQLAHATVNGASLRTGDLFASGTVSGPEPGTYGSLIELTWGGTQPLRLPDGSERAFLEDGDTVTLRGWCGGDGGRPRVGFGAVSGQVQPAPLSG